MQLLGDLNGLNSVVISFQFSTFVSLMQHYRELDDCTLVVISFQFSTFVSLMQHLRNIYIRGGSCD